MLAGGADPHGGGAGADAGAVIQGAVLVTEVAELHRVESDVIHRPAHPKHNPTATAMFTQEGASFA